jgi:hypothetical protein
MSSSVNIASFRALEELEISLGRFSHTTRETVSTAQRQIDNQTQALEEIVTARRRAVERWQETYDAADDEDDDTAYILRQLHEAEEKYNEARNWQRRVDAVCGDFARRATEATYLADEHADQARLFLKDRLRELYEYVGLKSSSHVGSQNVGLAAPVNSAVGSNSADGSIEVSDLAALSLPKGFDWIRIDELSPAHLTNLPSHDEFRKGLSAADMREGLELLRTRILPEIQLNPTHATREYFEELDRVENRSVVNSLGEIFNAYFGSDEPVRVDRFKGDKFFRIGNGRHRIAVARELGWTVIPGRIEEG